VAADMQVSRNDRPPLIAGILDGSFRLLIASTHSSALTKASLAVPVKQRAYAYLPSCRKRPLGIVMRNPAFAIRPCAEKVPESISIMELAFCNVSM